MLWRFVWHLICLFEYDERRPSPSGRQKIHHFKRRRPATSVHGFVLAALSCSCSVRQDGARARNRLTDCTRSVIPRHHRISSPSESTSRRSAPILIWKSLQRPRCIKCFGDVLDRKAIDVKPIVIEEVVCHDCLDSITSTSTVSLSTSTMFLIHARTIRSSGQSTRPARWMCRQRCSPAL